jgi:hypothetical protein
MCTARTPQLYAHPYEHNNIRLWREQFTDKPLTVCIPLDALYPGLGPTWVVQSYYAGISSAALFSLLLNDNWGLPLIGPKWITKPWPIQKLLQNFKGGTRTQICRPRKRCSRLLLTRKGGDICSLQYIKQIADNHETCGLRYRELYIQILSN